MPPKFGAAAKRPGPAAAPKVEIPEGVLLGLGNPILDATVTTDEKFLQKYELDANNVILAEPQHQDLFTEVMTKMKPMFIAGGANQNSIRVAQWLLGRKHAVTFFGCVGNDDRAKILLEKAQEVGVNVRYLVNPEHPTGLCASIIVKDNRSLVCELGAALHFDYHFLQEPENWALVEKAKVYYICGFPFPVSPPAVRFIADHAFRHNKILVMNLSATYLVQYFLDPKINMMPFIDILFGNDTEAKALCELAGLPTKDIKAMALAVSQLPMANPGRKRVVIFTQGKDPTIVAMNGEVKVFNVDPVKKMVMKDTNGCGDAFVGGFLSQLVQGKDIDFCLNCGAYAAKTVIKHVGCTFPAKPDFKP